MRHLRTIVTTSDTTASSTAVDAGVVLELLVALLAVLGTGDVRVAHRDLGDLASAYWPDAGVVELNPAATLERQAAGLVHGLRAIAAHHGHATSPAASLDVGVVRDLLAAGVAASASASGRPALRLVPAGAR